MALKNGLSEHVVSWNGLVKTFYPVYVAPQWFAGF
jgi:hypothetical protein